MQNLISENRFVGSVKGELARYNLKHRNAESPHVRTRSIPLLGQDFGCPVDQCVGYRFLDQHFAKVLVGIFSSIELNFAELAEHCRVVRLYVNRAWLYTAVYNVTVVQDAEAFGNVA